MCPQVRGLTKVPVTTEEEALRQFFLGEQARSTAQHALNANSSRSHALFTLHLQMRASAEAEERALLSKLNLVDLAGTQWQHCLEKQLLLRHEQHCLQPGLV
jgi:kinesin family protein 6/9